MLAHILPCVGLYLPDGLFFGDAAVEVGKQLLIAHGVERVEMPKREYSSGFLLKAFVNHLQYSGVDALVEFLTRAVEPYLDDVERPLLLLMGTE